MSKETDEPGEWWYPFAGAILFLLVLVPMIVIGGILTAKWTIWLIAFLGIL